MREPDQSERDAVAALRDNGLDDTAVLTIVTIARCHGFNVDAVGKLYIEARDFYQPDIYARTPIRRATATD